MALLQEVLLTPEQLAEIAKDADDPALKNPFRMHIRGFSAASIRRVSAQHDLVLVEGNEHTGLKHIRERHNSLGFKQAWKTHLTKKGQPVTRPDTPGQFRPTVIPEFDYVTIAEAVYSAGTRDTTGNKRPEVFEKFVGDYTHPDGLVDRHVLLLYKGTKVIHTLYPLRSTHNRKVPERFSLIRGHASTSWKVASGFITVTIPYYGTGSKQLYDLVFEFTPAEKLQEVLLWAYNDQGIRTHYMHLSSEVNDSLSEASPMHLSGLVQYVDLRPYEKAMRDTEEGKIPHP